MRQILLALALVALTATSCSRSGNGTALFQQSGRPKSIVTVLPVIDNSGCHEYEWDLSQEITDEIRKRTFESSKLYLMRDGGSLTVAEELNTPNPKDLIPHNFGPAEFAVVTELIEQSQKPFGKSGDSGAVINVALRLRVLDVRGDEPKVILQEVLDHEHLVARAYLTVDYAQNGWGSDGWRSTPCGIAHTHVVRDLVSRVEGYIEANR